MGTIAIIIIICMLGINSLFAAYELALASTSLGRLKLMAEQKKKGALASLAMKNRMEASLAVVQIGITLVGAIAAATGGAGAEENLAPWLQKQLNVSADFADVLSIGMVVLPLSAVTIIVGELVPKSIAIRNSEWVCLSLSPAMRIFALFVYPAVMTFEWLTKLLVRIFETNMPENVLTPHEMGLAELQAQARALRTSRIIGADQERIILGSSLLSKVKTKDIMIHAEDISMLNVGGSIGDHFVTIHLDAFSRFPVTEKSGDPQRIIGYVNIKDVFFLAKAHPGDPSIRQITRPLPDIKPDSPIGQVFNLMMREHVHLVLVKDESGCIQGIITLEDILEEIVGDIQDEFDRLPRRIVPSGNNWIVGGGTTVSQLKDIFTNSAVFAQVDPALIFADWLESQANKKLKGGDVVNVGNFRILVRQIRRQKVMDAIVSVS